MTYAIISDIHGNIHGLDAILADAQSHGVDKYLLLGDYASMFPFGNDVVNRIRGLDNALAIRGNGEDYFINFLREKPEDMTAKQYRPLYWGFRSLSPENLAYVTTLPDTATSTEGDWDIQLAHGSSIFYRTPKIDLFFSHPLSCIRQRIPYTQEEYLSLAKAAVLACPEAVDEILALPKGMYLFGHNHVQFHMEHEGRIFINPGACNSCSVNSRGHGEPTVNYTILTVDGGQWVVTERQVGYDYIAAIEGMHTTGYAAFAPEWSKVTEAEMRTGRNYTTPFVYHIVATGKKMGVGEMHGNNAVYDEAVKTWDIDGVYAF